MHPPRARVCVLDFRFVAAAPHVRTSPLLPSPTLNRYGNGDKRTVEQFLQYAGIDLVGKKVPGACRAVSNRLAHVPWKDASEDPLHASELPEGARSAGRRRR